MPRRYLGGLLVGLWACAAAPEPAPPTLAPPPPAAPQPPPPSAREIAERSWSARDQRTALEQSLAAWRQLAAAAPEDPLPWARLAEGQLNLAEWFVAGEGDLRATRAVLDEGLAASERALFALAPEFAARVGAGEAPETAFAAVPATAVEALLCYAALLWRYVAVDLRTAALYQARIEAALQRALALDPGSAAHRWLGILKARLPAALGGDLAAARQHFEAALRLDPASIVTRVDYAEHYAREARDRALWQRLLGEVTQLPADAIAARPAPERQAYQRAHLLLNHVDEVF